MTFSHKQKRASWETTRPKLKKTKKQANFAKNASVALTHSQQASLDLARQANGDMVLELEYQVLALPAATDKASTDKETAKILKGSEVPYQEASSSGATTTSFKSAKPFAAENADFTV